MDGFKRGSKAMAGGSGRGGGKGLTTFVCVFVLVFVQVEWELAFANVHNPHNALKLSISAHLPVQPQNRVLVHVVATLNGIG